MKVILASGSPRRKLLLERILPDFDVVPSAYEEDHVDLPPEELAVHHALEKARDVARDHPDAFVIGGDSFVVYKGDIYEKPVDSDDARRMLRLFSGNTVDVYTGQVVVSPEKEVTKCIRAGVVFKRLSESEIDAYVASGEPMDKAGSFGEDGLGPALYEGFEGDYFAVRGLSLVRLAEMLRSVGLDVFKPQSR